MSKTSTPATESNSSVSTKSTAPPKPRKAKKNSKSSKGSKSSRLSLVQAQAKQQAQMGSNSASLEQIRGHLSAKKNRGKYFTPNEIATAIGNGVTDKGVRKAMQKAGLAKGKSAVIESGGLWLCLGKAGNRNGYCAVTEGTDPPAMQ